MSVHSLLTFAALMDTMSRGMDQHLHNGLEEAGALVRDEAKRVLGTYEYGWTPLSPATVSRHGDTPGLETSEMHDTLAFTVDDRHESVEIGSDLDRAVWFELGTSRQPPRSFLAEALVRKTPEVLDIMGRHVHGYLIRP